MHTAIMGILNVTPDSFSDGGLFQTTEAAVAQGRRLIAEGADIVDIGGESTRPGAQPVPEEIELERVLPVIEALSADSPARLSIDTSKPRVADACLRAGATLVNDVTGLRDPGMARVAASHGAGVVIMHMRGTPLTMREQAHYSDLMGEVKAELAPRVRMAREAGILEVIVDPGIGFAKTPAQSFEILRRLRELEELGCPILVGPSRKMFLGALPGLEAPHSRLEGTLAAVVIGAMSGASMVRVHDVMACRKALSVVDAVKGEGWTRSC
ncbi:MAG: dihydropteroate synthase [Candidatus Solibacter usitatus]|nr:dihydropteroate synthase [Candidatus Solibacter usitatus]